MNIAREIQSFLSLKKHTIIAEMSALSPSRRANTLSGLSSARRASSSFNYIEAMKCSVVEEDKHKLQNPLPFSREATSIRVSKKNTRFSKDRLKFVVSGPPGEATVRVYEESEGVERCDITPSKPGKYQMEVFWNGKHIRGSPFSLSYKLPRARIYSDGLDLHTVRFRLGVEHKFKVDCSDLEEGDLQVTISPPTAAKITVSTLPEKPTTHYCKIIPQEIGRHEIAITHSGRHIYGSPFTVDFGPPGDASKCVLSATTAQHKMGTKVSLNVDTKEAGFGQLQAGIKDVRTKKPVNLTVKRTHKDAYTLEFDPGESMECMLAVKYDNRHIMGSPFRLLFQEQANCTAEGPGLESAQAGAWNLFKVKADGNCESQGALQVNIHNSNKERVETVVSSRSPHHFDVGYFPKKPGVYTVSLQWGDAIVPGSPFQVTCHSACLAVDDRPTGDITMGSTINFNVRPLDGLQAGNCGDSIHISARNSSGKETVGQAVWDNTRQCYRCTLRPDRTGKYPISVKLREAHVVGSPFVVTVIDPPSPQLVQAWGSGLVGTTTGKKGEFTVDVSKAGAGLLSVNVRDYQDQFEVKSTRDQTKRFIKVSYGSKIAGSFLMDVKWSGEAIPLSPFNITVSEEQYDHKERLGTLDKHEIFLGNVTSVGINGDWLKVWRSSRRMKQKRSNGQRSKIEDAVTYF